MLLISLCENFRIFETMDTDGSSSIDSSELKRFLQLLQNDTPIDKEVVEMIMTHLDVDGNGKIDRKEFETGLAEWAWEIEQHKLHNHVRNLIIYTLQQSNLLK